MDDTPLAGQGASCTSSADIQNAPPSFDCVRPSHTKVQMRPFAMVAKGAEPAAKGSQREPSAASPQAKHRHTGKAKMAKAKVRLP